MKLRILSDEHFACHACTNCCRDWHVELTPAEIAAIPALPWPVGDPLHKKQVLFHHAGKTYLAHNPDASCVFLNPANNLCRIHEQFGAAQKPVGCRLYPFQITPTFQGEATVTARFDCPKVRENVGPSHTEEAPALRKLAAELTLPKPLDETARRRLSRDQLIATTEFLSTLLNAFPSSEAKSLFLYLFASVLEELLAEQVTREALGALFPVLKQKVEAAIAAPLPRPNAIVRLTFRTLLAQYLRRDEDTLNGRATRAARLIAMAKIVAGRGSFHELGLAYPAGSLRQAKLFTARVPETPDCFNPYWRLVRVKLESLQFMGPIAGHRNVIEGLRSLALLYPLTRAVAAYHAANRDTGSPTLTPDDVSNATAAIDHAFGRSPVLNTAHARSLETTLLTPAHFPALLRHL